MQILHKKSLFLLWFIFLSIILQQCCIDCCKGGKEINYQVLNYNALQYWKVKNGQVEFLDPKQLDLEQADTLNILMKDSSIRISSTLIRSDMSLMACSPSDNFELYYSRWDSMRIQTLHDFDSLHPAGSTIDQYFALDFSDRYDSKRKLFSLGSLKNISQIYSGQFTLVLCKMPQNAMVQFKFTYFDAETGDSVGSKSEVLKFN